MIQLPKIERLTLPSVEPMGHILRDPPKAVFTRKIDKVQDNNQIINEIDASGDRVDGIQVFSRGINPFVKVEYSNNQNHASSTSQAGSSQQAYLPYRVANYGAFRPPVLRQENTMPLSRMPRMWTYAVTNPDKPDMSKFMANCNFDVKQQIKRPEHILSTNVKPTKTFIVQTPFTAPYDVKNVIKADAPQYSVYSNKCGLDSTMQVNTSPVKEVGTKVSAIDVVSNPSRNILHSLPDSNGAPKETRDQLRQYSVTAPHTRDGAAIMSDYEGIPDQVRNQMQYSIDTGIAKEGNIVLNDYNGVPNQVHLKTRLVHDISSGIQRNVIQALPTKNSNKQIRRNMPLASMTTNKGALSNKGEYLNSEYKLPEKRNAGSFMSAGTIPRFNHQSNIEPFLFFKKNDDKSKLQKKTKLAANGESGESGESGENDDDEIQYKKTRSINPFNKPGILGRG